MSENQPNNLNDIERHFSAIIEGHGETIPLSGDVLQPSPDMPEADKEYSVVRSDGTLEGGWQPFDAGENVIQLRKLVHTDDGEPVTLTKRVDVDAFVDTQRIADRLYDSPRRVSVEMAKRVLMVQEVMEKKRRETYPYDHRDDLHFTD